MDLIKIENKIVGRKYPCFIIAEAGLNHNGSLKIAKKLVDAAAEAKADAVKFQTFKAENVATANAPMAAYQKKNLGKEGSQLNMLRKLELSFQDFAALKEYCNEKGILFLSTPHSFDAVDFLDPLVPAFKIGSGDLTNIPLLEHVAKKNKPIILSTGMANMEEIDEAIKAIRDESNNMIIVMHCTTSYPCPQKDVNLRAMETIKKRFDVLVGYSDHTSGIDVAKLASQIGAVVIEKHFTIDKNLPGPDHKASLDPAELKDMVRAIREKHTDISIDRELVLGSAEKKPTVQEEEISAIVRKSVIANTDIPQGAVITKDMLIVKRPGTGIKPRELKKIIGKKTKKRIKKDTPIVFDDLVMKKICVVTGTRAEYGILKPLIKEINKSEKLELYLIVTGMHLLDTFGYTLKEIEDDGFEVSAKVGIGLGNNDAYDMAKSVGKTLISITDVLKNINPDMLVVLGDRGDAFAAVVSAFHIGIPIAHIHGGDIGIGGRIDESIRHAITKLAHIHFVATKKSAERVLGLGEEPWRVHVVGNLGLDSIIDEKLPTKSKLKNKYGIDPKSPFLIVVKHPLLCDLNNIENQIKSIMDAVVKLRIPSVVIYPNSDAGGKKIISIINQYKGYNFIKIHKNILHKDFYALMRYASAIVGNSSSGIIEAPYFNLPAVNIGPRQAGRERGGNVIDADYDTNEIVSIIRNIVSKPSIKEEISKKESPYKPGAAKKIVKLLEDLEIGSNLIIKKMTY